MMAAPIPVDEAERLADLRSLRVLDTEPEQRYDRIVKIAASVFETPIAYIALIDSERQWFKAKQGLCRVETDRSTSFCGHTINQDEPLVVPDALLDSRFSDNPMVTGDPHVRFYAGVPLKGPGGFNVATLCLADTEPREFSSQDLGILMSLAEIAERELRMVDVIEAQARLIDTQTKLVRTQERLNGELEEAARYVRSQLPAPMRDGPVRIDWRYEASSQVGGDAFGYHWLEDGRLAVYLLDVSGHGVGAALLSSSIHAAITRHTLARADFGEPASVIAALDAAFPMAGNDNKFFTCFYGVYDPADGRLRYASAGHPPAFLFAPDGARTPLPATGSVAGIGLGASNPAEEVVVEAGSRLYFFSDGAFEIPSGANGELLMPTGLADLIETGESWSLDPIVASLRAKAGGSFADDFSIVKMRFV